MTPDSISAVRGPASYFDGLAAGYDEAWTNTHSGRLQRNAVWRRIDPRVRRGDWILDIGCGTGEDALHLAANGAQVLAVDASPQMVAAARAKGVDARVLPIDGIHVFAVAFDMVLSNFGALNCVRDLAALRETLARLVRPGGYFAICFMGRFCLWESLYYALRGQFKKAARRWRGEAASGSLRVFYPSMNGIRASLGPSFEIVEDVGIGITVPPSFVGTMSSRLLNAFAAFDSRLEASGIGRVVGDHRLLIFRRS